MKLNARFPLFLALACGVAATPACAMLKPDDPAPLFDVKAALAGKDFDFSLAEALRNGPVVVYFYPKSFTSVCTEEAHEFAEASESFAAAGASLIGLSGDEIETQREFSSKECRDKFPVGADADLSIAKTYDATMSLPAVGALFASRISYVVAPDGKILSAVADSDAHPHIQAALEAVRKWRERR